MSFYNYCKEFLVKHFFPFLYAITYGIFLIFAGINNYCLNLWVACSGEIILSLVLLKNTLTKREIGEDLKSTLNIKIFNMKSD